MPRGVRPGGAEASGCGRAGESGAPAARQQSHPGTGGLLWTLDHTVSGDARLHGSVAVVVRRLAALVREHAEAEDALVTALEATLPEAMLTLLHHRYADMVRRAPTRPHPVTAGRPRLAAAAFRIEGVVDHVRDVMDGRGAPRRLAG